MPQITRHEVLVHLPKNHNYTFISPQTHSPFAPLPRLIASTRTRHPLCVQAFFKNSRTSVCLAAAVSGARHERCRRHSHWLGRACCCCRRRAQGVRLRRGLAVFRMLLPPQPPLLAGRSPIVLFLRLRPRPAAAAGGGGGDVCTDSASVLASRAYGQEDPLGRHRPARAPAC